MVQTLWGIPPAWGSYWEYARRTVFAIPVTPRGMVYVLRTADLPPHPGEARFMSRPPAPPRPWPRPTWHLRRADFTLQGYARHRDPLGSKRDRYRFYVRQADAEQYCPPKTDAEWQAEEARWRKVVEDAEAYWAGWTGWSQGATGSRRSARRDPPDSLRAAYLRLARVVHPDAGGTTAAFQDLQVLYRAAGGRV